MGDTQEIASTETTSSKPTPGSLVANVLRRHPSKPAPVNASALLRSAIGFEAPQDNRASPDLLDTSSDLLDAGYNEIADAGDAIGPARGIVIGLALMLPFWGAVGLVIRAALR